MARAQNAPNGLFAKDRIDIGSNNLTYNSTAVLFSAGIRLSGQANAVITGNSTGIVLNAGVKISNAQTLTGDSTGIVHGNAASSLPGNVDGGVQWTMISNSTGVCMAVNTTGTTWKYLNVTSVQPT